MTTPMKTSAFKEKMRTAKYLNLSEILQKKHMDCGRRIKENDVFDTKELNELCRYCLLEIYTEEHKKECLFIPQWIKHGYDSPKDSPYHKLTKIEMFNGHSYKKKPYAGDKPKYGDVRFDCLCPYHHCTCNQCPFHE